NIDTLRQIILTCRQNGIALDLALVPRHADYLEALDQSGLWPRYEQVIGALTRLVAADGDDAVRLWDFSGYDTYATEPVPAPTDRSGATRWFWEPSHFKRVLGEKILAAIYRGNTGYGVRLSPATLAEHLQATRQAKLDYRASRLAHSEQTPGAPGA